MDNYTTGFTNCCLVGDANELESLKFVCQHILDHQKVYQYLERFVPIPWFVVAGIHYRESDLNFNRHLHNGDPLSARTVHVPAGRPVQGEPPFSWVESAVDALSERVRPNVWDLETILKFCEAYNGFGYQKHGVSSPYLWSFTDKYTGGLFVADGILDLNKKDPRPGIVAIYKMFAQMGVSLESEMYSSPTGGLH